MRERFNYPLRASLSNLQQENLRLKRLLRENGVAWSPISQAYLRGSSTSLRQTRSERFNPASSLPNLPMEAILSILRYALQSPYEIIDPLSPLVPRNLTPQEKRRGNQVAIHFLVTCRALHIEGTKLLWQNNDFVFTSTEALRRFGQLEPTFRNSITHITLRIVARYFDDKKRHHRLRVAGLGHERPPIPVTMRPGDLPFSRGGFRCYAWNQVYDFLKVLSMPCRPNHRPRNGSRLQLMPGIKSMRMDLINFDHDLPPRIANIHGLVSHELVCTLDELQITGMPFLSHERVAHELSNLLKDRGLFLRSSQAFLFTKGELRRELDDCWDPRVVRCWEDCPDFGDETDDTDDIANWVARPLNIVPPVPLVHPEQGDKGDKSLVWKRISLGTCTAGRAWLPFSVTTGLPDEDNLYPEKGCYHSFWEAYMNNEGE